MTAANRLLGSISVGALAILLLGCDPHFWVGALEQQARQSVRQHMVTPVNGELKATPNLWGEGVFVSLWEDNSRSEPPVWLYLGNGEHTYALDPESARLTPRLRRLSEATSDDQKRARLDRTSIDEIRKYVMGQHIK
jgi:hypothetical protein